MQVESGSLSLQPKLAVDFYNFVQPIGLWNQLQEHGQKQVLQELLCCTQIDLSVHQHQNANFQKAKAPPFEIQCCYLKLQD